MRLIDADAFRDFVLRGKPIGLTICEYSESDILSMIRQQPTITPPPNDPQPLEELREIVKQLKWCDYQCEGGPLSMNKAFIRLKELAYRRKPEEGAT